MPDFYAHYTQGQKVLTLLPEKTAAAVSNRHLYNLGLQGPDIFYFHRPLHPADNPILDFATEIHESSCLHFLTAVLQHNTVVPGTDAFSYLMGFTGHFALDSCAHPYVNEMVEKLAFDHAEMEIEFDKFLLLKDGHKPLRYKVYKDIRITETESCAVADIYRTVLPIITPADILRSVTAFRHGKHFFYAPSRLSQNIRFYLFKLFGLYDFLQGHIMKTDSNPKSSITNPALFTLYHDSITMAAALMQNVYERIVKGISLSQHFDRCFA